MRHSLVDPYVYVQTNVMGHLVMLELARHLKGLKHFVYASSSSVYGANRKLPFAIEDRVDNPVSLYAATDEMHDKEAFEKIPEGERLAARGIEVGHIFYFGTKYSKPMNAVVAGPGGEQITVDEWATLLGTIHYEVLCAISARVPRRTK